MQHTVEMLFWVWIVLVARVHSVDNPETIEKEFADECVREHNKARSTVSPAASDMQYMVWDEDLAITARKWAAQCVFRHNDNRNPKFPSMGENLWAGTDPANFNVTSTIQEWVDEKKHYDYYGTCSKVCDHYTQVVWAQSSRVGCAVQLCLDGVKETNFTNEIGVFFVCNYAPSANIGGSHPYKSGGPACSGCKGQCVDKLCRSYGHEEVKSDELSEADEISEAIANGDFYYVPILVIRPLGLFFTFVAAYVARRLYPDVFCYE